MKTIPYEVANPLQICLFLALKAKNEFALTPGNFLGIWEEMIRQNVLEVNDTKIADCDLMTREFVADDLMTNHMIGFADN